MGMGYEGWIKIDNGTQTDYLLGTGGGIPKARQRLESSGAYGGRIKGTNQVEELEVGIGAPHTYDWINWSGSINFDLHEAAMQRQIVTWLFDRQRAATIGIKTRAGNVQTFDQCFWSSITLNGGANALVNGSISFEAITRDAYTRGGDYISNKTGELNSGNSVLCDPPAGTFVPQPLIDDFKTPIPGWNTKWRADLGSGYVDILLQDWTLTFNQEVVRFFACDKNNTSSSANPVEPKYLAVGPMSITFSGTFTYGALKLGSTLQGTNFASPDSITESQLLIADSAFYLSDMELTTDTDDLQGADSLTPIAFEYAVYGLTSEELV